MGHDLFLFKNTINIFPSFKNSRANNPQQFLSFKLRDTKVYQLIIYRQVVQVLHEEKPRLRRWRSDTAGDEHCRWHKCHIWQLMCFNIDLSVQLASCWHPCVKSFLHHILLKESTKNPSGETRVLFHWRLIYAQITDLWFMLSDTQVALLYRYWGQEGKCEGKVCFYFNPHSSYFTSFLIST